MSLQLDKLVGPLAVAGIVAIVAILWKISLQMETAQGRVDSLKEEIHQNRSVTCTFARKLEIIVVGCTQ